MSKSVKLATMLAVAGGLAIATAPATISAAPCGACSACSACSASCGACASACAAAENRPVFLGIDGDQTAVGGYDVVSYFKGDGTPVIGNAKFSAEHAGATYHFSSQENLNAFEANPASYAPQYGGHCAWALSNGRLAPGDPKLSKVVDGKLYLNYNPNVQVTWLKDIPGFLAKSEAAWPKIPNGASVGNQ